MVCGLGSNDVLVCYGWVCFFDGGCNFGAESGIFSFRLWGGLSVLCVLFGVAAEGVAGIFCGMNKRWVRIVKRLLGPLFVLRALLLMLLGYDDLD